MVSPETHDANMFFNRPPSKEIGGLRVDTMSPAQVSFIQSSTQWHKYYKPSSPTPYSSNIYPEDPVLFPGYKSFRGGESSESAGYAGALEGLGNEGVPRNHHMDNEWNTNSYGSYGDTGGDQPQKDYENSPFTDKSWWNSKSEGRESPDGYESLDGKTVAVPEPKNAMGELSGPLSRFAGRSHEPLEGGELGSIRQHSSLPEDDKATFFNKVAALKENGIIPQDDEDKVFFNGNQKLLQESNVASPPLDDIPGPSRGLGTALAEELLQKNRGKFRDEGQSTNLLQDLHEATSVLRSGENDDAIESQFLSKPLLDVKGIQRTTVYGNKVFDNDPGHVVLIRSHQVKEQTAKKRDREHTEKLKNVEKKKYLASKRNHEEGKTKHIFGHGSVNKLRTHDLKLKANKKSIASLRKRLCKRCSFPSPLKKLSFKIYRPHKDR